MWVLIWNLFLFYLFFIISHKNVILILNKGLRYEWLDIDVETTMEG